MKLSKLEVKDIRAEIEYGDETIVVKNPKGEVKKELLKFFQEQLEKNIHNNSVKKGRKKKIATDSDIVKLLIEKLTNIEIDETDVEYLLNNPSHELSMVMLYLSSIMQELIFETLANKNLEVRMQKNTLLEKDTLNMLYDMQNILEEIKHRKELENNGKDI